MPGREIDWRTFLNQLQYCYGCGRFGRPRKGKPPFGWKMLYQPHAGGPAGLLVCSARCEDDVREAMAEGLVTEPLRIAKAPMMDASIRQSMMAELRAEMEERAADDPRTKYLFDCFSCRKRINPWDERAMAIPSPFICPNIDCDQIYGVRVIAPGLVEFIPQTLSKEEKALAEVFKRDLGREEE